MSRNVRGSLFVDYVRMLRMRKDVDWSRHLQPADLSFLIQKIDSTAWYPMETFERMGLAILREITGGDVEPARMWGRVSVDGISLLHPELVVPGDPRETVMRFQVFRCGFFDYAAVEMSEISDEHATVQVAYGMSAHAEEAATWQTIGFFERLLELSGAKNRRVELGVKSWDGAAKTVLALSWDY